MIEITSLSGTFSKVDSDLLHHFIVGSEGLVVVRKDNLKEVSFASVSGLNDVWAKGESKVFLATVSGVIYFNKKELGNQDISSKLYYYATEPNLISNEVLSIDGLEESYILAGTVSGVTLIKDDDNFFSSSEFQDVSSVSVAPDGALYYGGSFGLAAKRTTVTGSWSADYLLDENTIPPMFNVNGLDSTIKGGKRVIGAATDNGVMIINEEAIVGNSSIIQLLREL